MNETTQKTSIVNYSELKPLEFYNNNKIGDLPVFAGLNYSCNVITEIDYYKIIIKDYSIILTTTYLTEIRQEWSRKFELESQCSQQNHFEQWLKNHSISSEPTEQLNLQNKFDISKIYTITYCSNESQLSSLITDYHYSFNYKNKLFHVISFYVFKEQKNYTAPIYCEYIKETS